MSAKAVFLDRDGTINRDVGYLNHPDQVELLPRAGAAIKLLNETNLKTIVISNQAGIAKGLIQETLLPAIHKRLAELLECEGARIDGWYYCPHHPEAVVKKYRTACQCRKPLPGLALQAVCDMDIALAESYVIGDKVSDVGLAQNIGARAIMVMTGYGEQELHRLSQTICSPPEYAAADLYDAVQWILNSRK